MMKLPVEPTSGMRAYSLIAPAKINLYLQIIGDRSDGFHELVMVLQSIDLADWVTLRPSSTEKIRLHCDHPQVPIDGTNLAYRAAQLMTQRFPESFAKFGGVDIDLEKHIPMGAGLAGGSTNAAAVLVGLDLMWQLGLTQLELQELGAELGSDVPFCISGGTALATGRGEKLDTLTDLPPIPVVLAKYRNLPVSTPWAYQTYRQTFGHIYPQTPAEITGQHRRSRHLLAAIGHQDSATIGQHLHNGLEQVVLPAYPQVQQLKEQFQRLGSLGTMMSGSGSTVFALCASLRQAEQLKAQMQQALPDPDLELWVTRCNSSGIRPATLLAH